MDLLWDLFQSPRLAHQRGERVLEATCNAIGCYIFAYGFSYLVGYIVSTHVAHSIRAVTLTYSVYIFVRDDIQLLIHFVFSDAPTESAIMPLLDRAIPIWMFVCVTLLLHNLGVLVSVIISGFYRISQNLLVITIAVVVLATVLFYTKLCRGAVVQLSSAYTIFQKVDVQLARVRDAARVLVFAGFKFTFTMVIFLGTFLWLLCTQDLLRLELKKFRMRFSYEDHPVTDGSAGPGRIRLLRSKPRSLWAKLFGPIEPFEFETFSVSIHNLPPYEAISYTWGNPTRDHELTINNKRLQVTASAYEVLQQRAASKNSRTIWLDAICINQDDETEKSHQVSLMKYIYEKSTRVVVWLGTSEDYILAIGALLMLRLIMECWGLNEFHTRFLRHHALQQSGIGEKSWIALGKLLTHPWFTRVWIVQEIVLPPVVHVLYGGIYMEWETFSSVMAQLDGEELGKLLIPGYLASKNGPFPAVKPKKSLEAAAYLESTRKKYRNGTALSLNSILSGSTIRGATDSRDKVFAFLGLMPSIPHLLQPDYRKSVAEVYFDVADYLVLDPENSWLLPLAGIGFPRNVKKLPSWAADWSSNREATTLTYHPSSGSELDAFPNFGYRASRGSNMAILHTSRSLTATFAGHQFDTIEYLGPNYGDKSENHAPTVLDVLERQIWLRETWNLARTVLPNTYKVERLEQPLEEAFWRTLIGDRLYQSRPAPNEYGEYYHLVMNNFRDPITEHQTQFLQSVLEQLMKGHDLTALVEADRASQLLERILGVDGTTDEELHDRLQKQQKFMFALSFCAQRRRLCITKNGRIGIVPPLSMVGDEVCIIYGTQAPYVLRLNIQDSSGDMGYGVTYKLLGECYLHGMMDGQAMENGEQGDSWLKLA